jgi:hypothetical protein
LIFADGHERGQQVGTLISTLAGIFLLAFQQIS